MTREIKFRAWDKGKKRMTYSDDEGVSVGGLLTGYEDYPEEVTLMQYTGLKDKNGKEIYEGDIVAFWKEYPLVVSFNDDNYGGVWGWNLLQADGTAECYYYGLSPNENYEVIGNIYENPELVDSE